MELDLSDLKIETILPEVEIWNNKLKKPEQAVGLIPIGIKVTHKIGLTAYCCTERSQFKNKKIALEMIEYGLTNIEK